MMLAEETRIESARLRELRLGDDLVDAAVMCSPRGGLAMEL